MLNGSYDVIVGNAVADFELRFTPGGAPVGDVTIAVNSRVQVDGEWEDRPDPMYVKCTVWWEMAENCAETITQGDRLIAIGSTYVRKWETREGDDRLSIEMTPDEIGPALRFAQAKITKMGRTDRRDDDRDDDRDRGRGRDRGNRRDDRDRGRGSGGRGGSRQPRTNDRGSRSERRGSSARDDRDDRGSRSRRDDDRGRRSGGRSSQSVWDDDRDDDPNADLPDDPDF